MLFGLVSFVSSIPLISASVPGLASASVGLPLGIGAYVDGIGVGAGGAPGTVVQDGTVVQTGTVLQGGTTVAQPSTVGVTPITTTTVSGGSSSGAKNY